MSLRLPPLPWVDAPGDHRLFFHSLPSPSPSPNSYASLQFAPRFPAELRTLQLRHRRSRPALVSVGDEEEVQVSEGDAPELQQQLDASPEDREYIGQINRVLDLLKKNRDMTFGEVRLTIMIEDPREVERKRLLGIDSDEVTREELVSALEDVHSGRIPENRVALKLLAEEMLQWPNLEVEVSKKTPSKSMYARTTDTGVDPREAAKRLNVDWDSAADIEPDEESDEVPVPPVVGYGALYLVTGFPILIGIAVVLILFYNSLQ